MVTDPGDPRIALTMLGHAGFLFESARSVVVTDPWLSAGGAFDAAWFPLPRNGELAPHVRAVLSDRSRERLIYVSHEHQDHFDRTFLRSVPDDVRVVIPRFKRRAFAALVRECGFTDVIELGDGERLPLPDGELRIFVDDSRLNRDSAVMLELGGRRFLDLNDCKLFDRLEEMVDGKPVDIFTGQFTGATWHPTCYAYEPAQYAALSKKKMFAKFETVAKAIDAVRPGAYVPSAGPACFLDPDLLHLNFEEATIFPRADRFVAYLEKRLRERAPRIAKLAPGDRYDPATGVVTPSGAVHLADGEEFDAYVRAYARDYAPYFEEQRRVHAAVDARSTAERLAAALEYKLAHLALAERVEIPLYLSVTDESTTHVIQVDFAARRVTHVPAVGDGPRYELAVPAWQIASVLDGRLTWEEFALTFRMRLFRVPDAYQPILHAFLILEVEDLDEYCRMLIDLENNRERITVEVNGVAYSVLRYCPHQGGDLKEAWVDANGMLTCPRHRWQFDCAAGGRCTTNDSTIDAQAVEWAVT